MRRCLIVLVFAFSTAALPARAQTLELFARGSVSKNYFNANSYIVSVSAATGLAITLLAGVRLEGRYTNATSLQNRLDLDSGTMTGSLNDVLTQTAIYSIGVDFDLLGPRSEFQPFLYVGVGYVTTERSYYYMDSGGTSSVFIPEPVQTGISGNLGLGFRIRIANALALEAEAFAYGVNVHKPNPLINVFASVGIRLFI
jgi:hypothetical protein